jgi:VanZ family protein
VTLIVICPRPAPQCQHPTPTPDSFGASEHDSSNAFAAHFSAGYKPQLAQLSVQLFAVTTTLGRQRTFILAVIASLYLTVTLYPYDVESPIVANHAVPQGDKLLVFDAPGIARTTAPPAWLDDARSTHRLKILLRVSPHDTAQIGPARIFTVSRDPYYRDVTVAQDGSDLIVRLRTPVSTLNGIPEHRVRDALPAKTWRNVEVDVRPGRLTLTLDGKETLAAPLAADPLARFDDSYQLALGNELTGDRAWLGKIARAVVITPAGGIDYLEPGRLVLPRLLRWFHNEPNLIPFRHYDPLDWLFNFVGFVPLGLTLGLFATPGAATGRTILIATTMAFLLSLFIELWQWAMPEHYPSVDDLILNTLGTALGVAAVLSLKGARPPGLRKSSTRQTL